MSYKTGEDLPQPGEKLINSFAEVLFDQFFLGPNKLLEKNPTGFIYY